MSYFLSVISFYAVYIYLTFYLNKETDVKIVNNRTFSDSDLTCLLDVVILTADLKILQCPPLHRVAGVFGVI